MRRKATTSARRILLAFLLVAAADAVAQEPQTCHPSRLDKPLLNNLARASTLRELDERWRRLPAPNAVERTVYAARRAAIAPGPTSDRVLMEAIPGDPLTFDLLYSLCYDDAEGSSDELKEIAGGSWIDLAVRSVLRQKHGYLNILMLPYVGQHNADIGETLPCTMLQLQSAAPAAYRRAFLALPSEAKKLVCPDCC